MTSTSLTPSAERGLEAAVVLLRETTGFMFLPLFVESERAASVGLEFLQAQLASNLYQVAWPVDAQGELADLRVVLLRNLDDAIAKLPPSTVVVLDASSSVRHALGLEAVAYINHRREPLRAAGLRLVLCWPVALKDELLSNAPDLWSVRSASPWIAEADLVLPATGKVETVLEPQPTAAPTTGQLSLAGAKQLASWKTHRNLQAADLSTRDALELATAQYGQLQWADAAELAEAVVRTLQNERNTSSDNSAVAVRALNLLGSACRQLGNLDGALQAMREANKLARQLAKANSAAYEPDLAGSINNLANRLSESGDRPGALLAGRETVEIYTRLAKANPVVYEPNLAMSLNNLAIRLSETGDRAGALVAGREAVEIYKRLAQANPAAYEPDLAMSINNLANSLSETGDRAGALVAAREAVEIRRRLAKANPAAYEPQLAGSLNNLANSLSETGDRAGAIASCEEALHLYEQANSRHAGLFEAHAANARKLLDKLNEA